MIPSSHPRPQAKRHLIVQPVLYSSRQSVPAIYIGPPPSPLITHIPVGIWNPINYMVVLAQPNSQPKRHLDRFSRFCSFHYWDRRTDHANLSVTIGRTYVRSTLMLPNNIYFWSRLKFGSSKILLLWPQRSNIQSAFVTVCLRVSRTRLLRILQMDIPAPATGIFARTPLSATALD